MGFLNEFTFDFSRARTNETEDGLDVLEDVDLNPIATHDFPWLKSRIASREREGQRRRQPVLRE